MSALNTPSEPMPVSMSARLHACPRPWLWLRTGVLFGLLLCMIGGTTGALAQPSLAEADLPSPIWDKVRTSLFQARPIVTEPNDVIALEAPARAEDAAIVPLAIRARIPQTPERYIRTVTLVIDNNPSPVSATFHFTLLSGRADIETRVRIEQYTTVRVIAETNDGRLFMASRYVKASGGCSAPPGKDPEAALVNLGRMKLRVQDDANASQPLWAQLMVNHPNNSGLVMDQVSRLYAPARFVHELRITLGTEPVLSAELDISISENPHFRFYVFPNGGGQLKAEVTDTQDQHFSASASVFWPHTQDGVADAPLQPLQLAPGVFVVPGALGDATVQNQGRIGNVGFIVGDSGVVVVNTGTSYRHGQQLLQAIHRVTDKPVRVALVTHTRPEFLLGAAAFQAQGIPVQMHHQAAELMRGRCERCLKKLQTLLGAEAMQGTVIFTPNQELEDSALLQDAGRRIQLLYFGHSSGPGDTAVLDEQSGVLFAGGLVDKQRIPDVQDGNLAGWTAALQRLRALSPTLIVPGHGAPGTWALLEAEDRYLTQLQARVSGLLQQGGTLQTLADTATMSDFSGWYGYDTLHKRNAANVFLRLEQAASLKP